MPSRRDHAGPLAPIATGLLLLAAAGGLFAHSIHISFARAEVYEGALHVRVTYYKDDFFAALRAWNTRPPATDQEWIAAKSGYLRTVWHAAANGGNVELSVTGNGEDETSIWFEFDFRFDPQTRALSVTHNALFAQFGDESNLLTVHAPAGDQSFMMTAGNPACTIAL